LEGDRDRSADRDRHLAVAADPGRHRAARGHPIFLDHYDDFGHQRSPGPPRPRRRYTPGGPFPNRPRHGIAPLEATIPPPGSPQASRDYAEAYLTEDEPLRSARARAEQVGVTPIGVGGGAALRLLAAAIAATHVVEFGTGTGVSGIWLLRGMRSDGVLTSIDAESENQRLARLSLAEAGFSGGRVRLIPGRALQVAPRLSDSAYDLVFCDAAKAEYGDYLTEALRLLRPGGVVAFDNALWHDRVADPSARDAETVAIRDLGRSVRDDERLTPALLSVGDGLLVAVKRP
jgi:predicted O-methyltransferase YrrM